MLAEGRHTPDYDYVTGPDRWFLEIAFIREVGMSVCICAYVSLFFVVPKTEPIRLVLVGLMAGQQMEALLL